MDHQEYSSHLSREICRNATSVAIMIAVLIVIILVMLYLRWKHNKCFHSRRFLERLAVGPLSDCGDWGRESKAEASVLGRMGGFDMDADDDGDQPLDDMLASISKGKNPLSDDQLGSLSRFGGSF